MKIFTLLIVVVTLFACDSPKELKLLKAEAFSLELNQIEEKIILDVRTPDEFMGGHITDAINLNINSADFESDIQSLDKNSPVFVYCLSGGRSHKAALRLTEVGFKNVIELDGGIMAWRASKLPESKSSTSRIDEEMTIAELEAEIRLNDQVLLDFYATWCGPCKKLKPELERLEKHYAGKLKIIRIDVDKQSKLAEELGIVNIPTLVYYKSNAFQWKILGFKTTQELITRIESK